jgi:hypothetical protein
VNASVAPGSTVEQVLDVKLRTPRHPLRTAVQDLSYEDSLEDFARMQLSKGFDLTDFNQVHCIVVHRLGWTVKQIIPVLAATCHGNTKIAKWRPMVMNYLYHWLYMFPEDFVRFPVNELLDALGCNCDDLNYFASPEVAAYAQRRITFRSAEVGGRRILYRPDQLLTEDKVEQICEFATREEMAVASRITFADLIRLDLAEPPDALGEYFGRIERTIRYVRDSVTLGKEEAIGHNLAIWMKVLLQCPANGNWQLVFEILSGVAQLWGTQQWKDSMDTLTADELWALNRIAGNFDGNGIFSTLIERMATDLEPKGGLGLFVPIFQRMRVLLAEFFRPGAQILKAFKDLRLFYDFGILVNHRWHVDPVPPPVLDQFSRPVYHTLHELPPMLADPEPQ